YLFLQNYQILKNKNLFQQKTNHYQKSNKFYTRKEEKKKPPPCNQARGCILTSSSNLKTHYNNKRHICQWLDVPFLLSLWYNLNKADEKRKEVRTMRKRMFLLSFVAMCVLAVGL